jgi:hypothetical protein
MYKCTINVKEMKNKLIHLLNMVNEKPNKVNNLKNKTK